MATSLRKLKDPGDSADEIPSLKREIRDLAGQHVRLLEQRGKNLIDQDIPERHIGPAQSLCDAKRELLSALEEQQRMRDNAAEIRGRIAGYCRQLEPKLANLDFDGKRALLGAFGVQVEAPREDVTITVVIYPQFDNLTTIARTLGCLSNSKYSFVIVELEEVVVQKRPRVVEFVPVDRGGDL